jgi:glycosyltransferase involved in cell wall biosynthesis
MFTVLPQISIIIATFNAEKTLKRCLDSIKRQTNSNFELIIIDGGSTDNTIKIIKENIQYIKHWVSEPDNGIYDAWNKGIKLARGNWIWFLGADDYFYSNSSIENVVHRTQAAPTEIKVFYSKVMLVNSQEKEIYACGDNWVTTKKFFFKHMNIPHQGVLHHKNLFSHRLFNTAFRICGDYELLLAELKQNDAFFYPEITVCMQAGGISSSPYSSVKAVKELIMAQKLHGQKIPSMFILMTLFRAYLRILLFKIIGSNRAHYIMDKYRMLLGKEPYWEKI